MSITNASLSTGVIHTVTVIELNEQPEFDFTVTQNGKPTRDISTATGMVAVSVDVSDPNPEDVHTFEWTVNGEPFNGFGSTGSHIEIDVNTLRVGVNSVSLVVFDNGSPASSQEKNVSITVRESTGATGGGGDGGSSGSGGSLSWIVILLLLSGTIRKYGYVANRVAS